MEVQILQEMLDEREKRIALLERKREDQDAKAQRLTRQLDVVKQENQSNRLVFQTEKTRLLHTQKTTFDQLKHLQQDWQQQGAASMISLPARIRGIGALSGASDAAYIMRMQAQLCKAMHSMGIMEHQMELAKKHAEDIIKKQKEVITKMTEDRTEMELKIMNELVKTDSDNRTMEAELKSKLEEIQRDIEDVEKQVEENKDSDDEEEDEEEGEEEDDEEEKEAKNELMMMLKEQNDKITKLKMDIELQKEGIEELETELEQLGLGIGECLSKGDDAALVQAVNGSRLRVRKLSDSNSNEESDEEDDDSSEAPEVDHPTSDEAPAGNGGKSFAVAFLQDLSENSTTPDEDNEESIDKTSETYASEILEEGSRNEFVTKKSDSNNDEDDLFLQNMNALSESKEMHEEEKKDPAEVQYERSTDGEQ